jgi:hypothetical protein
MPLRADTILRVTPLFCPKNTITGSMVFLLPNFSELTNKIGIHTQVKHMKILSL